MTSTTTAISAEVLDLEVLLSTGTEIVWLLVCGMSLLPLGVTFVVGARGAAER